MFDYLTILGWGVITNGWVPTPPPPQSGILSNCILHVCSDLSDNKHACNGAEKDIIHAYVLLNWDKNPTSNEGCNNKIKNYIH